MRPRHAPSSFAVIEIGTNSTKFAVARLTRAGGFRVVRFLRATTRVGGGLAGGATMSPAAVDRTARAIRRFRRSLPASMPLFAFATDALRRARNAPAAAGEIERALACPLTVLSGREEARLVYSSAARRIEMRRPRVVLLDVGGGSTEIVLAERGRIRRTRSLPLGALLLTERYLAGDPVDRERFAVLAGFVDRTLERALRAIGAAGLVPRDLDLVASGGTAVTAAGMSVAGGGATPAAVRTGEMARHLARLLRLRVAERKRLPGLEPDRADILPAGLAILISAARHLGKRAIRIHTGGLLDGVLWRLTDNDLKWPR